MSTYDPTETIVYANCGLSGQGHGNASIKVSDGVPRKVADYLKEFPEGYSTRGEQKNKCCACASDVKSIKETAEGKDGYNYYKRKYQYLDDAKEGWGIHSVLVPEDGSVGVTFVQTNGRECSFKTSMDTAQASDNCGVGGKDNSNVTSVRAQKICTHPRWAWDEDCNENKNPKVIYPGSNKASVIAGNKSRVCNKKESFFDAKLNPLCVEHCKNNLDSCTKGVIDYCTDSARNNKNPDLCDRGDISKLITESGHCFNDGKLVEQKCQDFCFGNKGSGIVACLEQIKRHCTADKIGTDFCKKVLKNEAMWGNHNDEMEKYCDTPAGQADGLCVCFNKKDIENTSKTIKDETQRSIFINNPHCFYKPCASSNEAYKKTSSTEMCPWFGVCISDNPNSSKMTLPFGQDEDFEACDQDEDTTPGTDLNKLVNWANSLRAPSGGISKQWMFAGGGLVSIMCSCMAVVMLMMLMMKK